MAQPKTPRRPTRRTETQVGNYRLVRLIGEGGMAQVYEVKHVELGRRAALKMLRPDTARNAETSARFFTEARAMSLVEHPALIHVYEYGHLDDGGAYIVMEYVEGESLRELLQKRAGKLPALSAVSLARQVAAALQAAHDKGVVHRDLKPENIMIRAAEDTSDDSRIKILDFGIAKTLDGSSVAEPLLTRPGQVVGTPTYLAPEQANTQGKIGGHTDVYALGVLLFEMLTGRPPFTADTALEVVRKHLFSEPPRLQYVAADADAELDALLMRMLAKQPENRPSMREVKGQLRKIGGRLEEIERRAAAERESTCQADTFILKPKRSLASVAKQYRARYLILFRERPIQLAVAILLFGFLGLGIWLVRGGPSRPAPNLAPNPTRPGVPEEIPARPVKGPDPPSTAEPAKTPSTAPAEAATAPVENLESPRIEVMPHPEADDAPQALARPVFRPTSVKPEDVPGILQLAQSSLQKKNYRQAIAYAESVQKLNPPQAWRLIGIAACMSKNIAASNEAYQRLDVPSQQRIAYECQRNGIERTATGFRLAKPPLKPPVRPSP